VNLNATSKRALNGELAAGEEAEQRKEKGKKKGKKKKKKQNKNRTDPKIGHRTHG
jgi:hypothetical protein